MKRRLDIGTALLGDPQLLIMDEPINGLDPVGVIEVRDLLLSLKDKRDKTVLISSHNLDELEKVATSLLFSIKADFSLRKKTPTKTEVWKSGF